MEDAYTVATTDAITAMPSAATTWRTVFCTADPAPDLAGGTASVIRVVQGATTLPRPNPRKKKTIRTSHSGVWVSSWPMAMKTKVTTMRPNETTRRAPNRPTIFALRGAASTWPSATGRMHRPACNGE